MNILLTGGAGFIGSNLVSFFLKQPNVESVRVMDNLVTGHMSNLEEFLYSPKFSFFQGDIQKVSIAELPSKAIGVFTYLALIGSMVGFGLFGYLSKVLDATLVSTYTYVNPIIALFLGNLILGESLSSILLLASSLILSAVLLITNEKTSTQ